VNGIEIRCNYILELKTERKGIHFLEVGLEGSMILKFISNIIFYACIRFIKFVRILYVITTVHFLVTLRT
jgi:hypothetical protein